MAEEKDNNQEDFEALFQNTEHVSDELPESSTAPSADELFSGKYGSSDDQESASTSQQELAAKALAESEDEDPFADLDSVTEKNQEDTVVKESSEDSVTEEIQEDPLVKETPQDSEEDIGSLIDAAFADELKRPGEVDVDGGADDELKHPGDVDAEPEEPPQSVDETEDDSAAETGEELSAETVETLTDENNDDDDVDVDVKNVTDAGTDVDASSTTLDELLEDLEQEVIADRPAAEAIKKLKQGKKKKKKKKTASKNAKRISLVRILILLGLFLLVSLAGGYWWLKTQKQPVIFPGIDTLKNTETGSESAPQPKEKVPQSPESNVENPAVIVVQPDPSRPKTTTLTFYEIPEIRARLGEAGLEVTFSLGIYARNSQIGPDIRNLAPNIKVLVQNIFYLKPSKKLVRDILEKEIQEKLEFLFPKGEIQRVELRNLNSELISP